MEALIEEEISDETFKHSTTKLARIKNEVVRLVRLSFVGELGFELHIPRSSCQLVYMSLMECGKPYNIRLAGYRALYSLSCEKGTYTHGRHFALGGVSITLPDLQAIIFGARMLE